MDRLTTNELYSQLQERIVMDLEEDEIICPECKGLRFVYIQKNGKGYIESCRRCHTGKLTVCKYCGKANKSWCDCKEAQEERYNDFRLKQAQKELEAYHKAEKIDCKDYEGYFILSEDDFVKDSSDLEEWLYERLVEGEDVPEYLWAVEGVPHFSIDLKDVVSDKCEDGYEDMYSRLDTDNPLLSQAQELIEQWEKEQGESLYIFNTTHKKAVIIKDLVDEIRNEIKSAENSYELVYKNML